MDRPERIALFGGTFDPVHLGHIRMIQDLLESRIVDAVWVLPSPDPPHKASIEQSRYEDRVTMLELALDPLPPTVTLCEVERVLPRPSYTIQTLAHLQSVHPDARFFLTIGADSLVQFHTWRSWKEILSTVPLIVASRPGWSPDRVHPSVMKRVILLNNKEVDISSRELRRRLQDPAVRFDSIASLLPVPVADHILKQGLYREEADEQT